MNNTQNGPKPGYLTTEFWTMILSNVVGILLTFHAITQQQANSLQGWVPLVAAAIIFVVVNASYIRSRTQVKVPWEQALATLIGYTGPSPAPTQTPASAPVVTPTPATITPIPGVTLPVTDAT